MDSFTKCFRPFIRTPVDKISSDVYKRQTWQSESDIGIPWIKPDVLEYLRDESEHPNHYIFVPIAFISEHIEVLFDND